MILRKVLIKDYKKIKKLFEKNKLSMINNERWKNIWLKNPILKNNKKWIKGWVIEENKKIVGHFGSYPTQYFFKNKSYICSVLHGWVVDKKFRSFSPLLLNKLFMDKKADFFLCTTANPTVGKIFEVMKAKQIAANSLKYSLFFILNLEKVIESFLKKNKYPLKKLLSNIIFFILNSLIKRKFNSWKNKYSERNIIKCKKINPQFDYLWKKNKYSNINKFLFNRNTQWLEWHLGYFLENKKAWILLSKKNKKINGYSICIENLNKKDGLKRAFLVDLFSINEEKETSINLIGASINEAKKRKCHIIEFRGINNLQKPYVNSFYPFSKKLLTNPFYYKSNNNKLDTILKNEKFWLPTYLDGDTIVNF